jgi:hypothetical protein
MEFQICFVVVDGGRCQRILHLPPLKDLHVFVSHQPAANSAKLIGFLSGINLPLRYNSMQYTFAAVFVRCPVE